MKHHGRKFFSSVVAILALIGGVTDAAAAQGTTPVRQRYQWYLPWDAVPIEIDTRTGFLIVQQVNTHDSVLVADTIALSKVFVLQNSFPEAGKGNDEQWSCISAPESYTFIRGPDGTIDDGITVDSIAVKPATAAEVTLCAVGHDVDAYRKAHPYRYAIFLWFNKRPSS